MMIKLEYPEPAKMPGRAAATLASRLRSLSLATVTVTRTSRQWPEVYDFKS